MGLFGPGPASFTATFASALVASGAWIFNYFIRGEALAERHVAKLRQRRRARHEAELKALEAEWAATGYDEGERQARELRQAYQQLVAFLEERVHGKGRGQAERLKALAEDTYREGAGILRQALDAFRALRKVDRNKLESELFEWRAELGRLKRTRGSSALDEARTAGLDTRIAAHERRLRLWEDQANSAEKLLAESEVLEAALESTYLELVDLDNPEALFSRGHAVEALERAVTAARRVDERLRGLSAPSPEAEDVYLAAADRRS